MSCFFDFAVFSTTTPGSYTDSTSHSTVTAVLLAVLIAMFGVMGLLVFLLRKQRRKPNTATEDEQGRTQSQVEFDGFESTAYWHIDGSQVDA